MKSSSSSSSSSADIASLFNVVSANNPGINLVDYSVKQFRDYPSALIPALNYLRDKGTTCSTKSFLLALNYLGPYPESLKSGLPLLDKMGASVAGLKEIAPVLKDNPAAWLITLQHISDYSIRHSYFSFYGDNHESYRPLKHNTPIYNLLQLFARDMPQELPALCTLLNTLKVKLQAERLENSYSNELRNEKTDFNLYAALKEHPALLLATIEPYHQLHDIHIYNRYSEFNVGYAIAGLSDKPELLIPVLASITRHGMKPEKQDFSPLLTALHDKPVKYLQHAIALLYPTAKAIKESIPADALSTAVRQLSGNLPAFHHTAALLMTNGFSYKDKINGLLVAIQPPIEGYQDKPADHLLEVIHRLYPEGKAELNSRWLSDLIGEQLKANNHAAVHQLLTTDNIISQTINEDNICNIVIKLHELPATRQAVLNRWNHQQQSAMTDIDTPSAVPVLHPEPFIHHPQPLVDSLPFLQTIGAKTDWNANGADTSMDAIMALFKDHPDQLPLLFSQLSHMDKNKMLPNRIIGSAIRVFGKQPEVMYPVIDSFVAIGIMPQAGDLTEAICYTRSDPEQMTTLVNHLQRHGATLIAGHINNVISQDMSLKTFDTLMSLLEKSEVTPVADNIACIFSFSFDLFRNPKILLPLMERLVKPMDKDDAAMAFSHLPDHFRKISVYAYEADKLPTILSIINLFHIHHHIVPTRDDMNRFVNQFSDETFFAPIANKLINMGGSLPASEKINYFLADGPLVDKKYDLSLNERTLLVLRGNLRYDTTQPKGSTMHLCVTAANAMDALHADSPLSPALKIIVETGHRQLENRSVQIGEFCKWMTSEPTKDIAIALSATQVILGQPLQNQHHVTTFRQPFEAALQRRYPHATDRFASFINDLTTYSLEDQVTALFKSIPDPDKQSARHITNRLLQHHGHPGFPADIIADEEIDLLLMITSAIKEHFLHAQDFLDQAKTVAADNNPFAVLTLRYPLIALPNDHPLSQRKDLIPVLEQEMAARPDAKDPVRVFGEAYLPILKNHKEMRATTDWLIQQHLETSTPLPSDMLHIIKDYLPVNEAIITASAELSHRERVKVRLAITGKRGI